MLNEKKQKLAHTIMVQGTASDVGKSIITAALCRILTEDGYRVAPFKSQNMSLNSYVTWDGKEIGRAQGMQADACGVLATTDMNPILLKPKKDMISQVVIHGKPLGDYAAKVYREEILAEAGDIVTTSLASLRSEYDIVVLEGAGSPAEINLKDRDIVNMRAAAWADAPVVLVADIDRGGMFASIVGTLELLEPHERDRVCGFIVNKFRGDVSLLTPGLEWLEAKTGKPVLGVVPYLPELGLEDEDSLSLDSKHGTEYESRSGTDDNKIDIAVIRLPHISNFTDIDPFFREEDVSIRYVANLQQWANPDAVIIPGSKNAVDDLHFLRESGLADRLERFKQDGGHIVGICGGYEMLGRKLLDPHHAESDQDQTDGLGWFPFDVAFAAQKRTVRVEGTAELPGLSGKFAVEGYEIHMGTVHLTEPDMADGDRIRSIPWTRPFRLRTKGDASAVPEGIASADGHIWGTFLHGVMHNDELRRSWINRLREGRGWQPLPVTVRMRDQREQSFRRLADHVRCYVDIDRIKHAMGITERSPS
ncbi:cobyric acid synthase [Paenibacillus spongiae]|uniref:Cobyric acid synthase n=1 Tax=Paenibacillus spongiae TaxID=2909671 RepID=A0ABY5SF40_9BACL|nr:cobyric acid synthase [Paenibacillus spongiae]UVI32604.1 cobyric acid synthase [Paenibacillus spongiae]